MRELSLVCGSAVATAPVVVVLLGSGTDEQDVEPLVVETV